MTELLCIESDNDDLKVGESYHLLSDKSPCRCARVYVGLLEPPELYGKMMMCASCFQPIPTTAEQWHPRRWFVEIDLEYNEAEQVKELTNQK